MSYFRYLSLSLAMAFTMILVSCGDNPHVTSPDAVGAGQALKSPAPPPSNGPGPGPRDKPDNKCKIREVTHEYAARGFEASEITDWDLPYRSTAAHAVNFRFYQHQDGFFQGEIPFVKDKQIPFLIQALLIDPSEILEVLDVTLVLDLTKLSSDNWEKTELICLLDKKICSGTLYGAKEWQENFNPDFWNTNEAPHNSLFTTELMSRRKPVQSRQKNLYLFDGTIEFNLDDLLAGSEWNAEDYLFDGLISGDNLLRTIPIVIADDTVVRYAGLEVTLKQEVCN